MSKRAKRDKRLDFLNLVPENAKRILDIGCGHGKLTSVLAERGYEVIGIDRDPSVCEEAKARLSEVHCLDIENDALPFEKGSFDCIILADVLDCLVDPLKLMQRYRDYLSSGGFVLVSMANIRYYKVIKNLLFQGTWDYVEPGGILWWYHLRFFTLLTSKELFGKAGFDIDEMERFVIASSRMRFLNALMLGKLLDLLTYQYYFRLKKQVNWKPGSYKVERQIQHF